MFDKASLIGNKMIRVIDTRLQHIKYYHASEFGELDVISCGDLCQASHVRDGWIFSSPQTLEGIFTKTYWQSKIRCYELKIVMPQDDIEGLNRFKIVENSSK